MAKRWLASWLLAMACAVPAHAQTVEYIHTDALGTPVAVTDANGNVIEHSEYEPYGALLNKPITDGPGYTGHVMDAATGLVYMQQRYYDPSIGGFLSVDPVSVDTTTAFNFCRYCYANSNPYKFTDPDGRQSIFRSGNSFMEAQLAQPNNQEALKQSAIDTGVNLAVGVATIASIPVAAPAGAGLGVAARVAPTVAARAGPALLNGVKGAAKIIDVKTTELAVKGLNAIEGVANRALTTIGVNPTTSANVAAQIATPAAVGEFSAGVAAGVANVPSPPTSMTNYAAGEVANSVRERVDR